MPEIKILVVEDDDTLRDVLVYNLAHEGYAVTLAQDGAEALEKARGVKPDLMLLDLMLPVMNGLEVCRIIRGELDLPIIILTAKTEEVDRVVGLEMGADDYITKPFSMRELLSRIKAVLRRTKTPAVENTGLIVQHDRIRIDTAAHLVYCDDIQVELNPREFELLAFLVANKGQVMSREQILRRVWGYEYIGSDRTVDVHMRWLRQKLEGDPDNPRYLKTVRGYGYKFEV